MPTISGMTIFPADNIWNKDISSLPVLASSAAYMTSIGGNLYTNTWGDGASGFPFNVVNGTQALVPVHLGTFAANSDGGPYPIPPTALVEAGSDKHCLVLNTGNNKLYEMYNAVKQGDNSWNCDAAAIWDLTGNMLRPSGWLSADAAGLPMLPGLVRYDEIAAGSIQHALRLLVPSTQNTFLWPARHQAGSANSNLPPMGVRIRLKASVNISGFSAANQVILTALKTYGGFVADNGGSSGMELCGAPDNRFSNSDLANLTSLTLSNFEAIDESSLLLSTDSAGTTCRFSQVMLKH